MWVFWALIVVLGLMITLFLHASQSEKKHFTSQGVYYYGNSTLLMVGNMFLGKKTFLEYSKWQYTELKRVGADYGGVKEFGQLTYVIKDPSLIKHVLVKDFDHFVNRRAKMPSDKFIEKMLIFQNDEQWKSLRSKLSPTFTTGKIKRVFSLFDQSAEKLVKYVENKMSLNGEIDLADGYSKFTMDTIASAVCGIDSQAFLQDEASVFEQMGKKLQLQFTAKTMIKFITMMSFPRVAGFLGLTMFGSDMEEFFSKAIKASIKMRKGEKRDDFIQLMLEAREGQLKLEESELDTFEKDAIIKNSSDWKPTSDALDDDGIVANCVLFILAGFDTTQSLLLYVAYSLALNHDVQDKLREEVERNLEENGGKFTYEGLQKLNYLDMVINETLRVYPPAPMTDRGCTQDYKLPGTDVIIKKGSAIVIPIIGLHQDEKYFPEPEKFKPERWTSENKAKMTPYTYLPFGQGPRNCIGMRFALTEIKLAIAQLVHNFNIEPSAKTLIPMEFDNSSSLKPKGGKMWLALNKRN